MRGIVVAALIAGVACSSKKAPPGAGSAAGSGTVAIAPLAGGAPLTIVLYPDHWGAIDGAFDAVLGAVPPPMRFDIDEARAAAEPYLESAWAAIRYLALRGPLEIELPSSIPGVDDKRPVVIEAFDPIEPLEDATLAVLEALAHPGTRSTTGTRIRASIPATQSGLVGAALVAAMRADSSLREVATAPPTFGDARRLIRVVEDKTSVTVSCAWGHDMTALDAGGRDRVLGAAEPWVPQLHPLLADPSPSVARAHLRLDRFADAGATLGMTLTARALVEFPDAQVSPAFMMGFSESLVALLINDARAMTVSDAVFDLSATEPYGPTLFSMLTERGVAAARRDPKLATGVPVSIAELDLVAIAKTAPRPAVFDDVETLRDVTTMLHECGPSCLAFLGLGNGAPLVAIAEAEQPGTTANAVRDALATDPVLGSVRVTLAGSTLVVEKAGGSIADSLGRALALAPRSSLAPTPASDCYIRALIRVRGVLRVVADEPARTGEALSILTSDIRADLECAAKDAELAPRVAKLREAIVAIGTLARAEKPR